MSAHFILWTDRVRKEGHPTFMWCHLVLTVVTNSCVGSRWARPQACKEDASTAAALICWPALQQPQPLSTNWRESSELPSRDLQFSNPPPPLLPLNCAGNESQLFYTHSFSFLSEAPPPLSLRVSGKYLGDLSRQSEEGSSICQKHSLSISQDSPDQFQLSQWSRGSKAYEIESVCQYLSSTHYILSKGMNTQSREDACPCGDYCCKVLPPIKKNENNNKYHPQNGWQHGVQTLGRLR